MPQAPCVGARGKGLPLQLRQSRAWAKLGGQEQPPRCGHEPGGRAEARPQLWGAASLGCCHDGFGARPLPAASPWARRDAPVCTQLRSRRPCCRGCIKAGPAVRWSGRETQTPSCQQGPGARDGRWARVDEGLPSSETSLRVINCFGFGFFFFSD